MCTCQRRCQRKQHFGYKYDPVDIVTLFLLVSLLYNCESVYSYIFEHFQQYIHWNLQNFGRGEVSSFLIKTPYHIGVPLTFKVWHDNSALTINKASWFLGKVVLIDLRDNNWYVVLSLTHRAWTNITRTTPRRGLCKSMQICKGHPLPEEFLQQMHNKKLLNLENECQGH